jgi:hypothetical protein
VVQHLSPDWVALHAERGGALPERAGATARLQHVVTGAPDGEVAFTLEYADGRLVAARHGRDDSAADCTFLIAHQDAVAIAQGVLDLHAGFMQGRVKMSGPTGPLLDVLPCTESPEHRELLAAIAADTRF